MAGLAIIGGTGLNTLPGLEETRRNQIATPYGKPSGPLVHGRYAGREVAFLARHGEAHSLPPHRVNYRANLWALKHAGVDRVVAVATVGGIRADMQPGYLVFPDQIIDYTNGRHHTVYDEERADFVHIDFTEPYDTALRAGLVAAAGRARLEHVSGGTYGAVQGPRLETAAEIRRMEKDGCDLVGMTGMPEAALARELGLAYACCGVISNRAAGKSTGSIHSEMDTYLKQGMARLCSLLEAFLRGA